MCRICFALYSFCCFTKRTDFVCWKLTKAEWYDLPVLNHSGYVWRRFLLSLSTETVQRVKKLTSGNRKTVALWVEGKNRNILRPIRTELASGIPVTVAFVHHRSQKNECFPSCRQTWPWSRKRPFEFTRCIDEGLKFSSNAPNRSCVCRKSFRSVITIWWSAIRRLCLLVISC